MHHRSKLVLAVGALLLATPALSSCGFNLATDRINTVQHGGTNRDASVDLLAVVIVSATDGSGTLSGRIVNSSEDATELSAVTALDDESVSTGEIASVEVPSGAAVAMADLGDGVRVEGDFAAGDIIDLTFEFTNGEQVEVEVPVVRECGYYADLDSAPTVGEGGPAEPSESAGESASPSGDEPSTEPTDEAAEETDASSCETEAAEAH
ncbi:hypothetical protein [Nocardioides lijunqiniae]|uniref:hypothetical protein n=1 Tax=Nocardioides lijunqiniae TaxID=2760832 RepID=UPI00187879AF|nr:hypothetical protein [Nocardioides lijunqiniae]